MALNNGTIVIMGSGELTATMVEVHKELLSSLGKDPKAVFLDTPAGFQPNVDGISAKAVEYFRTRVHWAMDVASFKSKENMTAIEGEQSFQKASRGTVYSYGPGKPYLRCPAMDRFSCS